MTFDTQHIKSNLSVYVSYTYVCEHNKNHNTTKREHHFVAYVWGRSVQCMGCSGWGRRSATFAGSHSHPLERGRHPPPKRLAATRHPTMNSCGRCEKPNQALGLAPTTRRRPRQRDTPKELPPPPRRRLKMFLRTCAF